MAVFKRPGAAHYSYDFRHRGRRFSGSTGCTSKRRAEQFEDDRRREVAADEIDTSKPLAFADAVSLWWLEVGKHRTDTSATERILAWLQTNIGKRTPVADIDDALVARLVAKRRGETRSMKVPGEDSVAVPVANATVNRSVVEPLRAILRRAETVWRSKVQQIDWKKHKLKEPQERVREASPDEEALMLAAIPDDYRPALAFALMTGCRRAEVVGLTWQDVNFFAREFRVTGKGDRSRTIPMTDETHDLLWALKDHHPTAVFTFKASRTRDGRHRGKRYPITINGFQTVWARHVRAKTKDFRFHDTRHTAATRLVRATGNLRLAQILLGHADMATTTRYAHVTHEDLRNGLEAAVRAKSHTTFAADGEGAHPNGLKRKTD